MISPATVAALKKELALTSHRQCPADPLRRAALVAEEAGEALKAALDLTRSVKPDANTSKAREELRRELVQTATMALRVLTAMEEEDKGAE
jgi:NTP pyrophosphatase (non-canonical NTP hydrolase)